MNGPAYTKYKLNIKLFNLIFKNGLDNGPIVPLGPLYGKINKFNLTNLNKTKHFQEVKPDHP